MILKRKFRRIQQDMFGAQKILLVEEWIDSDNTSSYVYQTIDGHQKLVTPNKNLTYSQFLKELKR